ncbi:AI-2E family transporter [Jiulongibacter sediminis]|jgi:predicted PurR-regulated permease PerM|uniref:AI-2E family transporter n=1 Tax=Jiulongibacter sediminis TaxID=1605367 RepID=UPI0026EB7CEA|nr:AI-2E family transporter [Jiulongibacter sediminis]
MIKPQSSQSVRVAATLLSVVILVFSLSQLQDILVPIIFAGILSFLLLPVNNFFETRLKFPRVLGIIVTILLAGAMIAAVVWLMVGQIKTFDQIWPQMIKKGEEWLEMGQSFIAERFSVTEGTQLTEARKYLTDLLKNSGSFISGTLSNTTGFLANLSLIPLYIFLMLLYRDFFQEFLYKAFKSVSNHRIDVVLGKIKSVVQSYMSGLLLVILIVGTLNTTALLLLGIPNAVFFGFFAAVLVLVPYIGVAIGSLLPIMMALITKDSAWYAVGVAASFGFIQFLEGNFITPFIVGSKVSINSLVAIISLLLFGSLWGISGLVLALPLTAIIKVLFDNIEKFRPIGFLLGDADHSDVGKKRKRVKN